MRHRHRAGAAILFLIGVLVADRSYAQPSPPAPATFSVASIRPTDPGTRGGARYSPAGDATIRGFNVRLLLQQSYDIRDFQIIGGPDWMGSDRFDITAKADPADSAKSNPAAMRQRLQALLKDRFHLQAHVESRVMERYELVSAKSGSKLQEDAPATPEGRMSWGTGFLKGQQVDVRFMTVWLARLIGQPVSDQTGLKSTCNFELRWSPDANPKRLAIEPEPDTPTGTQGPSIFTAVQEQLGLKLEPRKGPVDVLVIDHVERPTPD